MIIFVLAVNSSCWLRLLNTLLDVDVLEELICSGIVAGVTARGALVKIIDYFGGSAPLKIFALPFLFIVY